ncbi:MAG: serine/threonine-protein kinase [Nannocystaceae bacterium]
MERSPSQADAVAETDPSEDPGLKTTMASDRSPERTNGHLLDTSDNATASRRDLVAEVVYYQSNHDLFGAKDTPPRLGKYTLERLLGSGAFGAVILGRNPDTGGEVAIKILRTDGRHVGEKQARRFIREAQALAQLAHPNVVPIFDAGVAHDARYIVMRRVSGTTLRQAQVGRSWREVVDLYVAAARGLAAVHAAGLVHCDFKADNVLVSDDGQVLLADFGLVRLADDSGPPPRVEGRDISALIDNLTRTGEVFGTPAYMSPEIFENAPVTASSDLFALAASLFEALYGSLPYAGDTLLAIYLAAAQGEIRARPEVSEVPEWIDGAIRAALHPDPRRRPASIDALIGTLDFRSRERLEFEARARKLRRRRFSLGLGIAAACGIALGAATLGPPDPCAAPEAKIADVWPAPRGALSAAVNDLRSPEESARWTRLRALIDGYVDDWSTTYRVTCRATFHTADQSEELFDARVACLDQRRRELHALVEHLQPITTDSLVSALQAAARLDPPTICTTATRLPSPTDDQRRALVPIQDELADARVRELLGDYDGAAAASERAVRAARAANFEPTIAEALIAHGRSKWLLHDGASARDSLAEAVDIAEAAALDSLAADAGNLLTKVAALELLDPVRGEEWARQTDRKLVRIGDDPRRRAELLNNRGLLAFHVAGDVEAALAFHREALALREALPGDTRTLVAASHQNLGNVLAARGSIDEATHHYDESRRLDQAVLGDAHPRLIDDIYNRAVTLYEAGEYGKAAALAEEALAGYRRSAGMSADVAATHILLAAIAEARHDLADGLAHARLAAEIALNDPTSRPDQRALTLERIGSFEREGGDPAAALATYERGLAALGGQDSFPDVRSSLHINRASAFTDLDRFVEAHHECELALALAPAGDVGLERYRAAALRAQARAFMKQDQRARARAPLEDALIILDRVRDPPANAEVKFLLARSIFDLEGQGPRALALARESLTYYQGAAHTVMTQEILAWIHANEARRPL